MELLVGVLGLQIHMKFMCIMHDSDYSTTLVVKMNATASSVLLGQQCEMVMRIM